MWLVAVWHQKQKIIVLVDTVLIGRSIGGVISWNSGIQSCQAIIYALPFAIMASHVPTIFILISIQREKASTCRQLNMMSDTGFTCPKCDHSFPTAEQVAEHLRNEHVDGTQTESTKRMT
jgi:hypothetical protein